MGELIKYYVVQRLKDGKWVNDSTRFIIQGLTGALRCYTFLTETCPCEQYRIAKGKTRLPE